MIFAGLRQRIRFIIRGIALLMVLIILPSTNANLQVLAKANQRLSVVAAPNASSQVLNYQGRLLDPTTGQPKADGAYQMSFSIYNSNSGGAALWTEAKSITVNKGLFSTLLGDSTPLDLTLFSGQELWLGVTVGTDPEMTPRQRLAHAPYAIYAENSNYAENANLLGGQPIYAFAAAGHNHLGEVWTGQDNSLVINGSFNSAPLNIQNSGGGDSIYSYAAGGNAIDARNNTGASTIYAENGGAGNTIYAQNSNQYASIYVNQTGSGNGVGIDAQGGNSLYAANNSNYAAVFGRNFGPGPGGWFTTYSGDDILIGEEEVTRGTYNIRFRVVRNGEVYADGAFHPGGADFAEMLPAVRGLEPGDVLVIGPQGALQLSSTPNASTVVGIYSTKPGVVGGWNAEAPTIARGGQQAANRSQPAGGADQAQASAAVTAKTAQPDLYAQAYAQQGKVPVAVVGVVPVKASTENGPIQPGDLLTTSATPGHAMKATLVDVGGISIYRPGTIVGKALTPLVQGTGVITAVVTLQ